MNRISILAHAAAVHGLLLSTTEGTCYYYYTHYA